MTRDAAMAHLETYLAQVRRNLRGLSEAEIREVLLELRAHVLDRVEGNMTPATVEAALAALGSPREVGRANVTERVAAVMESSHGFFGVLAAVVRLASLSVMGFVLFLVSVFGYSAAVGFIVVALWKPVQPDKVGMWLSPEGPTFGVTDIPGRHEVLGWWIIPVALFAALAFGWLTRAFSRLCVRAMARTARRRRPIV